MRVSDQHKFYPLNQSPFYKVKSPAQLADILGTNRKTMIRIASGSFNYIQFENHRGRDIQWPKPTLRRIQKRAANLLGRIETPNFLHSAKKGRSYITNADQHSPLLPSVKVDIRKFFQSVRAPAVFHFFKDKMLCAPDVAGILARIFTLDKHLPTGGNVSPILSYFAYMDMFAEIDDLARRSDCVMTCLMDDMAFTGSGASGSLIYEVGRILGQYRRCAHKTKVFKARQVKIITGIAITTRGRRVPNKRQKAIAQDLRDLRAAQSDEEQLTILRRATGRAYEAAQVDPAWLPRAKSIAAKRKAVEASLLNQTGNVVGKT
jgi:RNA-directed DNA polymerase